MGNGDSYVLDSFALIGYLENEPFAQEIEDLLDRRGTATRGRVPESQLFNLIRGFLCRGSRQD